MELPLAAAAAAACPAGSSVAAALAAPRPIPVTAAAPIAGGPLCEEPVVPCWRWTRREGQAVHVVAAGRGGWLAAGRGGVSTAASHSEA
jgi:hypothetical protein